MGSHYKFLRFDQISLGSVMDSGCFVECYLEVDCKGVGKGVGEEKVGRSKGIINLTKFTVSRTTSQCLED